MTSSEEMLESAQRYAANWTDSGLGPAPSRNVAVVACMDARLDLFALFGLAIGDSHLIRNAGGTVTDDVLRSLIISQHLLGTRETVLVHHTQCGMTMIEDEEFLDRLEEISGTRPGWSPGAFREPEIGVHYSLQRVRTCPWLISNDVRGFVFDVGNGQLKEIDPGG